VLLGTLGLERVTWPASANVSGSYLDLLARQHLWEAGLDYAHGTGHGVGHYLNVHEGPCSINSVNKTKLEVGMCVSDEPGYYHDGEFGIRIENVIMVQKRYNERAKADFKYFENLTVAPYCRELLDLSLINEDTRNHINAHHQKCLEKLTPLIQEDARALAYVQR